LELEIILRGDGMGAVAEVLKGFAQLLWPLLILWLIYLLRKELPILTRALHLMLGRIKSVDAGGLKLQLEKTQDALIEGTDQAQMDTEKWLPSKEVVIPSTPRGAVAQALIRAYGQEERKAKIVELSSRIERELKVIAASLGDIALSNRAPALLKRIVRRLQLPESLDISYAAFWSLRNQVMHNWEQADVSQEALDSANNLFQIIREIPRPRMQVVFSTIPLYSDSACSQLLATPHGVLLQGLDENSVPSSANIYPTTRTYSKDSLVTWEWNRESVFGLCYYRDPATDEIRRGWDSSMEFVGRNLEEI
jgi:hypothetical protein